MGRVTCVTTPADPMVAIDGLALLNTPPVTALLITTVPAVTHVTTPADPMVAIDGLALLHTPPVTALLNVVVDDTQTFVVPVIVPPEGVKLTVTVAVA